MEAELCEDIIPDGISELYEDIPSVRTEMGIFPYSRVAEAELHEHIPNNSGIAELREDIPF